ncbi:MAG TPA: cache domain-containing protein [Thermoanaerobaculia bacterium]|nr:cache domain-containing protein [Thermoanaerobaculia bacterium]
MRKRSGLFSAAGLCLAAMLGAAAAPAEGPPPAQAHRIEALVDRAAALVVDRGEKAFPEFRVRGSRWFNGFSYVFVDDMSMVSLVNGPRPQLEGRNVMDLKDASGRAFHREWTKILETADSAWVSYLWPRPGHVRPSRKWTYIRKVTADGRTLVVGAGVYQKGS